ncbi:MAG: rhomboid family intramembrane serine protease [Treponema sp.]|nr:rhomboid family intramembrane serine protease [Treponema sp.]
MSNLLRKPFKYTYKNATLILIFINIAVFFFTSYFAELPYYLAMNPIFVIRGHYYFQFITYMFVHGNWQHLFFNMLGLLVFGLNLERGLGSKEFLCLYLVTGFLSGLFSFITYYFTNQPMVFLMGASGALYAILFTYAVFFPRSIIYIWGILPVPAPILVLVYAIIEAGSQFLGRGGNVAHMAHLYGFLGAWLYIRIRMGIKPLKVWRGR